MESEESTTQFTNLVTAYDVDNITPISIGGGGELDNKMACGTAYGQVQLYDVRALSSVRQPTVTHLTIRYLIV
jgi:hypothetical protein